MKDKISEKRIALLHPKIAPEVLLLMNDIEAELPENCAIRVVQGLRTIEQQNRLYAQGRTTPGAKVTNARGGSSYHNYGLAFDYALLYDLDGNGTYEQLSWKVNEEWKKVAAYFEQHGYFWGGKFSKLVDNPHIEKTFGINWREMLRRYTEKRFIPDTQYIVL